MKTEPKNTGCKSIYVSLARMPNETNDQLYARAVKELDNIDVEKMQWGDSIVVNQNEKE